MMEKRNFVTSTRTPGGTSPSDVDDIIEAGLSVMRGKMDKRASDKKAGDRMVKRAMAADELSDRGM